jgi:hypothetical protein
MMVSLWSDDYGDFHAELEDSELEGFGDTPGEALRMLAEELEAREAEGVWKFE